MSEKRARQLVRERSGGVCEVCGAARATNYQHRKNRSQGGPWSAANGLDVCGSGTTGCHGYIHAHPDEACLKGWSVRSWDDEHAIPVQTHMGPLLLDDEGGWAWAEITEGALDG
ncbi:hypothetical protein [Glycomyces arizonensis]|uniref:hypothetical protein n=1 Tax=Glycomyces arizonensis TaxID=256035 RepID=UPI00040C9A0F|nr:hypothetical protein [Glycomyces arizonensis]